MVGWLLALALAAPVAVDGGAFRTIGRAWFNAGADYLARAHPHALAVHLRTCGNCHGEVAAEWRGSLHAQAWTDPVFQAAYRQEPVARCRHCHAPHGDPQGAGAAFANDGVSCAACHVRDGAIFAVQPRPAGSIGHAVAAAPDMASAGWCAGCHQFGMFATPKRDHAARFEWTAPQQDTFAEWTRSPHAAQGQACQFCHMPPVVRASGKAGRSHRFLGATAELVPHAVAVSVRAAATGSKTVATVTVSAPGAGHAFPTGDIFRRVRLRLWCEDKPAEVSERVLARSFRPYAGRDPQHGTFTSLQPLADTRVPPGGERQFSVPLPNCATVQWSLDYDKMPVPDAKGRPGQPELTVPVGRGQVAVAR